MDIINSYQDDPSKEKNLVYMAKPIYGGWVTFTAHLNLKYNYPLFKIGKRSETNQRNYGYDVAYQNLKIEEIVKKPNLMITAIDKHYYEYLHLFPKGTILVIHDPTELKGKDNPVVKYIHNFRIITIRETVQKYLKDNFNVDSEFKVHPFHEYKSAIEPLSYKCVSVSRIDFDKNTDLLLKANLHLEEEQQIQIFGAENRLYVHHKLVQLNFKDYWKGKFDKVYPLQYENKDILKGCKYMIDMSTIKNDGGGTQYTFLEAIHNECVLILHNDWIDKGTLFVRGKNCLGCSDENDITQILQEDSDYQKIVKDSKKILRKHIDVEW